MLKSRSILWAVLFLAQALTMSILSDLREASAAAPGKPNLLIITVDDMSCDSVGVFGCKLPGTTPNIDDLATQCMRFNYAHSVVGNCMPSRNVIWSGRYPHNNRIEGFRSIDKSDKDYPVLGELMSDAGWLTAIRHKVSHSTPYSPFPWSLNLDADQGRKLDNKNAATYGQSMTRAIEAARTMGQPFCVMLNIADPHKPFYAEGKGGVTVEDNNHPSLTFTADEVPVPGFLPDDPVSRKELAHYYSSVRRADDAVGSILSALRASGEFENTAIVFLSDHGMPLPFAKTQLYHHSTRTPLMVRWPGVTKPGSVDERHMISTVDLLPTLLDIAAIEQPGGLDGRSFAPILRGQTQAGRDMVFKEHNENSGGQNTPMRAVQTKDWLYVFSPWSNGTRVMSGATAGTPTCRRMRVLAKSDAQVAARVDLFDHRLPEEAYQVSYDPDALDNRIDNPEFRSQVARLERELESWMERTGDPLLDVFRHRDDPDYRENYVKQVEQHAKSRVRRGEVSDSEPDLPVGGGKRKESRRATGGMIALDVPATAIRGQEFLVTVSYKLPDDLGATPIQVTLKGADDQRIERKTLRVQGSGSAEVVFVMPEKLEGDKVRVAGLVGNNIKEALQHLQTPFVPLK